MSERAWHYERGTGKVGPFQVADLQELAKAGLIRAGTLLIDATGQRLPASDVLDFGTEKPSASKASVEDTSVSELAEEVSPPTPTTTGTRNESAPIVDRELIGVNENQEVWRFDDCGVMVGPFSWLELKRFAAGDCIKPHTEILHEDGRRFTASKLGLFPRMKSTEASDSNPLPAHQLPKQNLFIVLLILVVILAKTWSLHPDWLRHLYPLGSILLGGSLSLLGIYIFRTGAAPDFKGQLHEHPSYHGGGLILTCIGVGFIIFGFQNLSTLVQLFK